MVNNDLKRQQNDPVQPDKRLKSAETLATPCIEQHLNSSEIKKPGMSSNVEKETEVPRKEVAPGALADIDFDFEKWFLNPVQPKPCYYFEDGLRKVKPYYYVYEANAKGRWFGRSIFEIFSKEFQDQNSSYYELAIKTGRIRVNKKIVSTETIVENGDVIHHIIHRHEPPVSDEPISIIYRSEEVIAVYKPSGMPVHPSGRYRFNTLLHILANEFDISKFFPANRLDRLTSGIVLVAQHARVASEFEAHMKDGSISKWYYCRVNGDFPKESIICNEPIKTFSHKLGLNHVHPEGKSSTTIFERISYNGKTSLIKCQPLTGRTHQIRVHLLHIGFPIANDPLYKLSKDADVFLSDLSQEKTQRASEETSGGQGWSRCNKCLSYQPPDPSPEERTMWLHAFCYSGPDWSYTTTDLPDWAKESFEG